MESSHLLPDTSKCRVRHLTEALYECLTDSDDQCENAVVAGSRSFCRHPDRCTVFKGYSLDFEQVLYRTY